MSKLPNGFHVASDYVGDGVGLTKAERAEERAARGQPKDGRARKRGSFPSAVPVKPPFDELLRTIGIYDWVAPLCKERGVSVHELPCGTKAARVMAIRRLIWEELRKKAWSYEQIARLFGYASHGPVYDGLNGGNHRGERKVAKTSRGQ